MKRMLYIILLLLLIPLGYVGFHLALATATRFHPAPVEEVEINIPTGEVVKSSEDTSLTFLIWNVGYGGLGKDVDFFYDGGKMVISPITLVKKYIEGIYSFLETQKETDFVLLQEVDVSSRRSNGINMEDGIRSILNGDYSVFTTNYQVRFLPFPWTEPMGKIHSGLLSLSLKSPIESKRIAFPGITDFPRKLFYLERCMLMQRFATKYGKDLVVINTHLEAYDDGGVKKQQMAVMKKWALEEYNKGNYVVIGGDWNIAPPDFNVHKWEKEKEEDKLYLMNNDPHYIPNWQFAYDGNTPTNRKNSRPLDDKTFTTVIDYYLVSPNVKVLKTEGVNAGFAFSDHNPVKLTVSLQ